MEFHARPATNADEGAIRDLIYGVLAEYGLKPDPSGVDSDLSSIEANYRDGCFEVYESEGMLLGCAALFPMGGGVCELRKMYLAASARGNGLGRRILERMIDRARVMGFIRMELETASCLKEAISLYVRRGFQPIAGRHLAERCDQAYSLDL